MLAPRGNAIVLCILCSVLSFINNFLEAYSNSYTNTSFETFHAYINDSYVDRGVEGGLSEGLFTWVWSAILNIWFIGYLLGTFITPYWTDNHGRRATLLIANAIAVFGGIVATIGVAYPVPEVLFVGRAIQSLSTGMSFGTLILFLQETTPTALRGLTSFLAEAIFLSINVIGMGFGMDAVFGKNLPVLLGVTIIPAALTIVMMLPMAETPKFLLINKDDREGALKALEYYRGDGEDKEALMDEMLKEADGDLGMTVFQGLKQVFTTPHLRNAFILGALVVQVITSMWPILFLSTNFLETNFSPFMAQLGSFLFVAFNFAASIPGMFAVEHFGRRPMLLSFGVMNTLCLVAYVVFDRLAYYALENFKYGCIVSLILYGVTYGAALGPIAWFITSELVAQRYRSLVQSMVFSFNTVMNFMFSFISLPVYSKIGVWGFLPLFIIPASLCLIYIAKYLPETKGREIYEIVAELKGEKYQKKETGDIESCGTSEDSKNNNGAIELTAEVTKVTTPAS